MYTFATVDTRQQILEVNFETIRKVGFQSTRTDKVTQELGITKGAFYHYFPNKKALGYAIIDEIIAPMYINTWRAIENTEGSPLIAIAKVLRSLSTVCQKDEVNHGCPLNNLTQEMSSLDDGFRERLGRIITTMQQIIAESLERGISQGYVKPEVNTRQVGIFIVASFEGAFGIGKGLQSQEILEQSMEALAIYTESLAVSS